MARLLLIYSIKCGKRAIDVQSNDAGIRKRQEKKQNTFALENNLEYTRVPRIYKEKESGIHQRIERQKSEFY